MEKISKGILKTQAWENASYRHIDLYSRFNIPAPLRIAPLPTEIEIIEELKDILTECAEFYPAILDLGFQNLHILPSYAEAKLEKGFSIMLQLQLKKNKDKQFEIFIDNLEKKWRYDLSAYYLLKLIKKFPNNANFYDLYAYAIHYTGNIDKAIKYQTIAIEKEPDNHHFISDMGWLHMFIKEYDKAEKYLKKAIKIESSDNIAKRNLEINEFLNNNNLSYYDFLLKKPDYEKIYNFNDENDDWEEIDQLIIEDNFSKFEALKYHILSQKNINYGAYGESVSTIETFFKFTSSVSQDIFLNEDIDFMHTNFKSIMHKFIFKHYDADLQILNDIFDGLNYYYGFLTEKNLIEKYVFDDFNKQVLDLKNELIHKLNRYNEIRHNDKYNKKQKEEIRDELFEGDHVFPFL